MTEAVFIQVGRGRVSLLSYVLLWSFTLWKLRSFLEEILLLLFQQPCVQFGLQATRPLKDYPRKSLSFVNNIAIKTIYYS